MKVRFTNEDGCVHIFDYNRGTSIIIEDSSFSWRKEGPLLLDVSLTNKCYRECSFCYRQAKRTGTDMLLSDYKIVLSQAKKCGVQQIAFGGGEPTLHPDFCSIIEMTKHSGIIPNYSTNGDCLDDRILDCTKQYCGAMAISIYGEIEKYAHIIKKVVDNGIKLNLHFIINAGSIYNIISFLESPPQWIDRINALVFLNYKPMIGDYSKSIACFDAAVLTDFAKIIKGFKHCSIGFDSCSISFINKYLECDPIYYDYCEAARFSAFIKEDLSMHPCSFYKDQGESLRGKGIEDIWLNSPIFREHRNRLNKRIENICPYYAHCHGGCPIYRINVCNECNTIPSFVNKK